MMKNIKVAVALLLALVCVFSFCACDKKKNNSTTTTTTASNSPTVERVGELIEASKPSKAVTVATYVIDDVTLNGTSTVTYDRSGSSLKATYTYSYERLAAVGSKNQKDVVEGSFRSQGNQVYQNGAYASYSSVYTLKTFNVPSNSTVVEDGEGLKLTAKIAAANAKNIFGQGIETTSDVTVVIITSATAITSISLSYQTAAGTVNTVCTYTYGR